MIEMPNLRKKRRRKKKPLSSTTVSPNSPDQMYISFNKADKPK